MTDATPAAAAVHSATLARQMPPVAYVNTGVNLAYYEVARPRDTAGRTPVILCHGWPELAFSWRHQLRALAAAGVWAVAPDQRGFGLSDAPEALEAYDMEHLCGDLVGLLDHLGADKAVWCGHDWGGLIVWQMPLRHPQRTAGVIGLNTPFIPRLTREPIAAMREALGERNYIVFFQQPGAAEAIFEADVAKTMRYLLRRPSARPDDFAARPAEFRSLALQDMLAFYDPATDTQQFLSPDEMAAYVETFTATGFRGGINWYRNMTRNWERSAHLPTQVEVPSLMITAENDAVLPPSMAAGMAKYCLDLETVLVLDSGHWTQQEQPEAVNTAILDWLARRMQL